LKINGVKGQENYQLYFLWGKHPFDDEGKLLFLPRTPDFYLSPKIPGGAGPPMGCPGGGKEDYCPPLCTLLTQLMTAENIGFKKLSFSRVFDKWVSTVEFKSS